MGSGLRRQSFMDEEKVNTQIHMTKWVKTLTKTIKQAQKGFVYFFGFHL